ncbi:MAG TPA: MlaE family lipid ABC transporter permease subunit [Nitratifractor sp.]|nr:MlaE family lipid ABC transporter permease subunit [Nitratifractor sp.]
MKESGYRVEKSSGKSTVYCYGSWRVTTIDKFEKSAHSLDFKNRDIEIDLSQVSELDTSGALLLTMIAKSAKSVTYLNLSKKQDKLIHIIEESVAQRATAQYKRRGQIDHLSFKFFSSLLYVKEFIAFLGELFIKSIRLITKPKNFRFKESVYFIQTSGINALPIIGMTAFLVGVVIAYQTIVQLTKFGADIFVVDTSTIAIARELGPMITAIVVAGRSASSYTAEIGAMKLTEELDAMKTMGFMPFYFLVIPRIIALVIALPLLIFFSDMVGILGAMVATKAQIGLSFEIFIQRIYEVLALKHYIIGIVKGPFFAFIIAFVGVFHGLKVSQDTESIGKETTQSVVNAIFLVIVCDALFSVVFTELGI